jgi:hypothetical protein
VPIKSNTHNKISSFILYGLEQFWNMFNWVLPICIQTDDSLVPMPECMIERYMSGDANPKIGRKPTVHCSRSQR